MRSIKPGLIAAGIGMAVNVVLAIVKIVTGLVGNSYALIADGIGPHDACRLMLTAPLTDDRELLAALDGFVEACFGPTPC